MGTWTTDAFGNDDACDWAYGLEETDDLSLVEETLDAVLSIGSDYLEAPAAAEALAAIEVIARLQGNWGEQNSYSEAVDNWVKKSKFSPSPALVNKAHGAIQRILAEKSELKDLWEETDDYEAWVASVRELRGRIRG